jgi:uncharacterized membrane protein YoaK (UPF0700 family)
MNSSDGGTLKGSGNSRRFPKWQRRAISKLTWLGFTAAIAGMLLGTLAEMVLHTRSHISLWMPWFIVFLFMVSAAYRRGVQDGRAHPTDADDPPHQT